MKVTYFEGKTLSGARSVGVYVERDKLYFGWISYPGLGNGTTRPYDSRRLGPIDGEKDPVKRVAKHSGRVVVRRCQALKGLPKHPPFTDPIWDWR